MLKKTITFTDYLGNEREEDFYFHLNKAEVTEMQLEIDGGLTGMLERIIQKKSGPDIIKTFKMLIMRSYGVPSPDGRKFMKSKEITEDFLQTEAYNNFFMELVTDAGKAADFIRDILPNMENDVSKVNQDNLIQSK